MTFFRPISVGCGVLKSFEVCASDMQHPMTQAVCRAYGLTGRYNIEAVGSCHYGRHYRFTKLEEETVQCAQQP